MFLNLLIKWDKYLIIMICNCNLLPLTAFLSVKEIISPLSGIQSTRRIVIGQLYYLIEIITYSVTCSSTKKPASSSLLAFLLLSYFYRLNLIDEIRTLFHLLVIFIITIIKNNDIFLLSWNYIDLVTVE